MAGLLPVRPSPSLTLFSSTEFGWRTCGGKDADGRPFAVAGADRGALVWHVGSPDQWWRRRASSGKQAPHGGVAVNPAAWLRYSRCSRTLDTSAAASVAVTARDSWAGSVTVTVTYRAS